MIINELATDYPLLYLNPDADSMEEYRRVVLKGGDPEEKSLSHYLGDSFDDLRMMDTPAGPVRVATFGSRHDFELVMRGFMAAKEGPEKKIPETQGAAMLTAFNWNRIHTHLAGFPEEEQDAEFKRFISVRENYVDTLVVLSRGPYSNLASSEAGFPEDEWLSLSDTIRRYHELTHVICRKLYPDQIDAVRDELVADAIGLYAALGSFDIELEKKFLGISGDVYAGGRLENYTDEPEKHVKDICRELEEMRSAVASAGEKEAFDFIPVLMSLREKGDKEA